jgi:hypothetical protein
MHIRVVVDAAVGDGSVVMVLLAEFGEEFKCEEMNRAIGLFCVLRSAFSLSMIVSSKARSLAVGFGAFILMGYEPLMIWVMYEPLMMSLRAALIMHVTTHHF